MGVEAFAQTFVVSSVTHLGKTSENMKKSLLIAVVALACSTFASAQSFVLDSLQQTVNSLPESVVYSNGLLRNLSDAQKEVRVRGDLFGVTIDHDVAICFGNLCFNIYRDDDNPYERAPYPMAGKSTEDLKMQIVPRLVEAVSTPFFTVFDGKNPADSLRFGVVFNISSTVSVTDINTVASVTMGPNPTTDVVTFAGDLLSSIVGVNVYSMDGTLRRVVGTNGSSTITVPFEGMASGMYQVMLSTKTNEAYRATISVVR